MANKTNAFSTRHKNNIRIIPLYAELLQLWEENRNSYDDYIANLRQLFTDHPDTAFSANQIACALSDDPQERKSIACSVTQLAIAADEKRFSDHSHWKAAIPELNHKKTIKVRHFTELDDDGIVISSFDTSEETRVYFLDTEGE